MRTLLTLTLAAFSVLPMAAQSTPRPAGEFDFTMPDGSHKLLSSYRGKVVLVSFFFTTCPHCQDMARLLSTIAPEYAPKGVQVIAAAFDDNAKEGTPEFVNKYVKNFPMGYSDRAPVLEFLQQSIMAPLYVPILVFIDRKGEIQDQYVGDPKFLADPNKNIRAELDKLLAKPAGKPLTHLTRK